jgi:hypothetical protein
MLQNCHLDRKTVSICISMIEKGVNPEALAVSWCTNANRCEIYRLTPAVPAASDQRAATGGARGGAAGWRAVTYTYATLLRFTVTSLFFSL